jgi:hypothetical protein
MFMPGPCFIKLDDDEAGGEGGDADEVEEEMGECAGAFL